MRITVDRHGRLAHPGRLEPTMLTAAFTDPPGCEESWNFHVATAAAYWLLDREPTAGPDALESEDPQAVKLWKDLKTLPRAEAGARVTAVHQAARKCQDTTNLLTRSAR